MKWILFAIAWVVGAFLHYWTNHGGGFHRSFWAAAVGYAIRFVFCSSTVAVFFLTLCLVDRTLANLQGVLLDGRHPFLCLVNLVFQVIRFFPWAQSAITDTGYIKSDVFYILFDVFEGVKKFYFAPY